VSILATRVDQLGREQFAAQYAGVELSDGGVVVYRKPSAEFDQAVHGLNLPGAVELRDAPYAAGELEALAERIARDIPYWQGRGLTISSVGPLQDGTAVEVGTPEPEKLAPLLPERYGAAPPIRVVSMGPVVPAGG